MLHGARNPPRPSPCSSQILQASATGLEPKESYLLALADQADGKGKLEPLTQFMTNPAGAAIVNAVGPIRQIVDAQHADERRYLVIVKQQGEIVQVQTP